MSSYPWPCLKLANPRAHLQHDIGVIGGGRRKPTSVIDDVDDLASVLARMATKRRSEYRALGDTLEQ